MTKIDIGNVRGVKGDKGEKGEQGRTPSYEDLKYKKQNDEFVTKKTDSNITPSEYYLDANNQLCNEEGYLYDENMNLTEQQGVPFDESIYGYSYKQLYEDEDGNFTNNKGELLDENFEVQYELSSFIADILSYLFSDNEAFSELISELSPFLAEFILNSDPTDPRVRAFFQALEGDIKYYVCVDDPQTEIYLDENGEVHNSCKYRDEDGNVAKDSNNQFLYVPLEKNALYLYNAHDSCTNEIMHYDIFVCLKANTVPQKLVDSNDFEMDYNVLDSLSFQVTEKPNHDDDEVYLKIVTRGTRGQFYSMADVDKLFENNVLDKLGANNGIAQLNSSGKVPATQLPSYVDDIIEGTMNNNETTFTPSNNDYIGSVTETGKIYLDTSSRKIYRWSGSAYVQIANPSDSGWQTLTLNSNFYNYTENNTEILPLQYRKYGNVVQIVGLVGLNADLTNGQWTIATLPSEFRPSKEMSYVCELYNNSNLWTCIVKTDGTITFNRLRDLNSSVEVTVNYANNSTDTVDLATATSYVTGKQRVDVLKINVVYLV